MSELSRTGGSSTMGKRAACVCGLADKHLLCRRFIRRIRSVVPMQFTLFPIHVTISLYSLTARIGSMLERHSTASRGLLLGWNVDAPIDIFRPLPATKAAAAPATVDDAEPGPSESTLPFPDKTGCFDCIGGAPATADEVEPESSKGTLPFAPKIDSFACIGAPDPPPAAPLTPEPVDGLVRVSDKGSFRMAWREDMRPARRRGASASVGFDRIRETEEEEGRCSQW